MSDSEKAINSATRKYFEDGCLCLGNGIFDKAGEDVSDSDAARFYENNCVCSRNYKHLEVLSNSRNQGRVR